MIKISIETKELKEIESLPSDRLSGLFTNEELSNSKGITLAGKLAAKAAFLRNAGFTRYSQYYKKVEIGKTLSGRPFLKILDNPILDKIAGFQTSISISHTKETAIAICVLYNENIPHNFSVPEGKNFRY